MNEVEVSAMILCKTLICDFLQVFFFSVYFDTDILFDADYVHMLWI